MKVFRTSLGIVVKKGIDYFLIDELEWDNLINDDDLFNNLNIYVCNKKPIDKGEEITANPLSPIQSQEIWASGVTYLKSKIGRQEESANSGGSDFYAKVYDAERPELFFKALANRVVGHGGKVRIRKDSSWNVPEPELTLVITSNRKIVGYTIGNDMSSRSIEGDNPLYLPQAKIYDACAAIGPCIYVTDKPFPSSAKIDLVIKRNEKIEFKGDVKIDQMKRNFEELVEFLYRECSFKFGSYLMTGTGIVPPRDFTLQTGDEIIISIDSIGTLANRVE